MRKCLPLTIIVALLATISSDALTIPQTRAPAVLDELVALERGAIDRWIRRDPQGYLELYAPEVTYFDPFQGARVDGIDAMKKMLAGLPTAPNPVTDPRYEMVGAKAQRFGEVAILTFNLISYGKLKGQPETVLARWNSTETYARLGGRWKIVHSHWSFTTPNVTPPSQS